MWLNQVRKRLINTDQAPWLAGIQELDTQIIEVGSGSAGEQNLIHIPTSSFMPDVLINNTTYPIALQSYTDDGVTVALDKYQTKVTTLSDDQIIGASYSRIDNATSQHVLAITSSKYGKAIHSLAPSANSSDTPVITTSGDVIGTRKKLTFDDIAALKLKFDILQVPAIGRRLVLSAEHWNDLLTDQSNKYYNALLVDFRSGAPVPMIAGFEIYQYAANPYFTTAGTKNPYGSVPGATDTRASVAFYVPNVVMKTGLTKQYFAPATIDPENQTNKLNYRHYFIVLPAQAAYFGAIVSAAAA